MGESHSGGGRRETIDNERRGSVVNVQQKSGELPTGADRPRLKIAIGTYGHTKAIKDGSIPIEGVDADMVEVTPIIQAFRRMVRDLEFDICEMAPTTYMIARALGAPYIAHADLRHAPLPPWRFRRAARLRHPYAEGPRRQESRRARLFGDDRRVDARHLHQRVRYGFVQGHLGRGRRGARHQPQAAAECGPRAGGQVAAKHDGGGRDPGRISPARPASAAPVRQSATGT